MGKKAGILNPHKYKMEGVDAKAGGSLLPATKKAAEKFIISDYNRQTVGLSSCKTTIFLI